MRLGIIIARKKGSQTFEVLAGPEIPLPEQIQGFKELQAGEGGDLEEIQLWNSSQGRARRHIFTGNPGINRQAILHPDKQKPAAPKRGKQTPASLPLDPPKPPAGENSEGAKTQDPKPPGMESILQNLPPQEPAKPSEPPTDPQPQNP